MTLPKCILYHFIPHLCIAVKATFFFKKRQQKKKNPTKPKLLTLICTVPPVQHGISMWIKNLSLYVSIWFYYCEWSENGARQEPAATLLPLAESCSGSVPSSRLSEHIAAATSGR